MRELILTQAIIATDILNKFVPKYLFDRPSYRFCMVFSMRRLSATGTSANRFGRKLFIQ
jgi:hypothetical protein